MTTSDAIVEAQKVRVAQAEPSVGIVVDLDHLAERTLCPGELARVEELHSEGGSHPGKELLDVLPIVVAGHPLEGGLEGLDGGEVLPRLVVAGASLTELVESLRCVEAQRQVENQTSG